MRSHLVSISLLAGGLLMSGGPLSAQEAQHPMAMDKMDKMADCPMMTAEMRGPGAALDARTALHLSPAQVTQLETIKGKLDQHHKAAMDSMQALHRQINTLAAAPQVDEQAVRAAFDQMGQLHGAMGYEMFRAQREAATVLTPQQIDALAAVGQAKMNTGAMKGMGGMCG